MAFQMGFTKEELAGAPPVPDGWYTLQFKQFKPKLSQNKDSVSLNAELAVIAPAEYEGRRVFVGMNTKMAFMWPDFVHSFGQPMQLVQDENVGTEKESFTVPGAFQGMQEHPDDPSQWKYVGPLTNATAEMELALIPQQVRDGKTYRPKNEVRQFKCALADCSEKHSTNLIRQS